ncbi:MAG TPA: hypothetical protein VFS08_06340 [Gemmatimonadaceae bacterium]|nr:hypothetical protein [Gemmatimonadaceae bacterium]
MYRTCLFCHADLGTNETVERFPVGRRLAFDAARGRLWVVCRRCERWNLSPLEERWEAIEACERLYRDARRRVSTDQIGLARLPEGLELVRIGQPQRPEFAAWRYGDQFGRRRRNVMLRGGALAAGATALLVGGPLLGVAAGGLVTVGSLVTNVYAMAWAKRNELTLAHPEGGMITLTPNQTPHVRLVERAAAGWGLVVPYAARRRGTEDWWTRLRSSTNTTVGEVTLEGAAALAAAGRVLARINAAGAPARRVQEAVSLVEAAGAGERFFASAASRTREWGRMQHWGDTGALRFLPPPVRLALEMAASEDAERRALEGELAELEAAWREAERIAGIADDLLLPEQVAERLDAMKRNG